MKVTLNAMVCYESKYGNTKRVAETIAAEIQRVGDVVVVLAALKGVRVEDLAPYDLVLLGGPTHFGGPTRRVLKFIDALGQGNLTGKSIAVFDTYLGEDFEKSVKKMEEEIRARAPGLTIRTPGLSIRVADIKGPIVDGELLKCGEFATRLVAQPIVT